MRIPKWITHTLMSLSALSLIACGGGGGGSSEPGQQAVSSSTSYPPSTEKLLTTASDSTELYVEENFAFKQVNSTRLSIQINDDQGNAIPYTRLNIYLIERDIITDSQKTWTDELAEHAQLIAGGQTNAQGEFVRIIEFPALSDDNPVLMIEVNALGIENKTLVTVNTDHTDVNLGL